MTATLSSETGALSYRQAIDFISQGDRANALAEVENALGVLPDDSQLQTLRVYLLPRAANRKIALKKQRLLNFGCGNHFHPEWVNIDKNIQHPAVRNHDIGAGIPFESGSFDAVYHSHVLEHLARDQADFVLRECCRVLAPGGIIRVVVPDLENIAREYLHCLDGARAGDPAAQDRYEWILIELLDQLVRHKSGGAMLDFWLRDGMPAEDYVVRRMGAEVKGVIQHRQQIRNRRAGLPTADIQDPLAVGRFRLSGEAHLWMYDRYSLTRLLQQCGFQQVRVCAADESRIPEFNRYHLDVLPDGSVRKPDSLFVEAVKA